MEKVANFREYSVFKSKDGRKMKAGKLYRSANLGLATQKDMETLRDLGIGTDMDFREEGEVAKRPDKRIKGIEYINVPASSFDMKEVKHDESEQERTSHFDKERMIEIYRVLPFNNQAYKVFFELLMTTDKAVLHHCSAGKDRAGLAAAMVLLLLDVSMDDVMKDYLETNNNVRELVSILMGIEDEEGFDELMRVARDAFYVSEDYINAAFNEILSKYPNFDTFFELEYGFTPEVREAFKNKYLEK